MRSKPLKARIVVPSTPPSLNAYARYDRWWLSKVHNDWKRMVWALCNESGNRVPRPCKFVRVTSAKIYFEQKRRRDETNYSATLWKLFLDGLVAAQVIPDDTSDFIKVPGEVKLLVDKKPRSEIMLDCYLS